MKISRYILPILATAWIGSVSSRPFGDTLRMRDFGALPDSGEDASEALRKAVATIGKREIPTVLCFESGRYDFHAPEGQDDRVNIVARLRGIRDLIIDGGGAEFIAHGRLMLFLAEECERLTIRNFSLDWERPYITQASIVALGDGHVDLAIDRKRYPYHIEKGRMRLGSVKSIPKVILRLTIRKAVRCFTVPGTVLSRTAMQSSAAKPVKSLRTRSASSGRSTVPCRSVRNSLFTMGGICPTL